MNKQTPPNFRPLHNNVLIKVLKEEKTASGIIVPTDERKKSDRGIVVAVGPGKLNSNNTITPVDVIPGDQVLFTMYRADVINLAGEDYLLMPEESLFGVFL